jgi:glycosyltransferase involved in cell wall biosynthesis
VVVATSPPLFTGLAGWALARLNRAPFVFDVRDLWTAAAVSLNQIPSSRAVKAGQKLERFLYRQATVVTAVTEPFVQHIDAIRARDPKAQFLPNGTLDMFFEVERNVEARKDLGVSPDSFVVMFAGTLGIAQALPSVLQAAELVGEGIEFIFLGDGPVRDRLADLAAERALANVHFHPQVPLQEVTRFLAAADALLVTLSAHPTFEEFVPSKLIDFMATGIPVILAAAGEAARIVERNQGGLVVAPEDPTALAEAIRRLVNDPLARTELARNGQAAVRPRLRSAQAEALESLLLDLVGRP